MGARRDSTARAEAKKKSDNRAQAGVGLSREDRDDAEDRDADQDPERGYVEARTATLLARRRAEMEWFIAWGRITFTVAIFLRTLSIGAFQSWKMFHVVLPLVVSIWVLWRVRRRRYNEWDLVAVVIADAVIAALALGTNIFEVHGGGYQYLGLFRMPDVAITVFVVALAALRFSERGVLASGLSNGMFAVGLAWVDSKVHGTALLYGRGEVSMHLIVLGSTTALGMFASSRLRRLLNEHALTLIREERTRTNLDEVLRDSHDVRASLQAAMIDVALLARSSSHDHDHDREHDERRRQTTSIDENLRNVADHLRRIRRYSDDEARALSRIESASPVDVVEDSVRALRAAFSNKTIRVTEVGDDARTAKVVVAAGARGLRRIIDNLVRNACEGGEGARSADSIDIRIEAIHNEQVVTITVDDDGPGFDDEARAAIARRRPFTRKAGGGGVGLEIVQRTIEESGGSFAIAKDAKARVVVTLQRA